jgi:acyl carrier protein
VITIDEVRKRVEHELRGKLPDGVTINQDTVIKDLGLSSLQISEIVFGLEEDHEVEFDAALAADAQTLGDLLAVANKAMGEKQAAAGGATAAAAASNGAHATLNGGNGSAGEASSARPDGVGQSQQAQEPEQVGGVASGR